MTTQPTIGQPDYPVVLLGQRDGTRLEPPLTFGPYLLHILVRRSNMSLLCKGTRAGTQEPVAVKICRREADRDRFQREIEHTQDTGIRGVIKIEPRDVGVTKDGWPFYATRWIDGPSLGEFLRDRSVSVDAKLAAVQELCRIVGVLHEKGLSHRDPPLAFPEDTSLSARHFRLLVGREGRCYAEDLRSTNGLWINGRRVQHRLLIHGDQIHAGNQDFVFHAGPLPEWAEEAEADA